jgi:outer membrane protein assembly factor BamB
MKQTFLVLFFLLVSGNLFVSGQMNIIGGKYAFLFTEHFNNRVAICNKKGEIVWEFICKHPQSAWVLPDGKRVLTSSKSEAMIIQIKDKKVLWSYKVDAPYEIPYVQSLRNGHFIVGVEGKNIFYEFDKKGKLVRETKVDIQSKHVHGTFRFVQRTNHNTYLIPVTAENQFREVDLDGETVRLYKYKGNSAISALRLGNGNTILGPGDSGELVEVDKDDKIVWKISNDNLPDLKINFVAGLCLMNNILFVANYGIHENASNELPQFFAIDRKSKMVVWRAWSKNIGNVSQIQIIDDRLYNTLGL